MSNITFQFYAIPHEFFSDDFIDDPIMMRVVRYIFKRISPHPQKVILKNKRKVLELDSFEFMYGRDACMKETGISERNARTRIAQLLALNFIEKVSSKASSTFSVYRLVTTTFNQNNVQQNVPQSVQHTVQHTVHKQELRTKNKELKKEKIIPFKEKQAVGQDFENSEKISKHSVYSQPIPLKIKRRDLVFTTEEEHADLLKYIRSKEFMKPDKEAELLEYAYDCLNDWKSNQSEKIQKECTDVGRLKQWAITKAKKSMQEEQEILIKDKKLEAYAQQGTNPIRDKVLQKFEHGKFYNGAECFINTESIAFMRGLTHYQLRFAEKGFWSQFENILIKLEIKT